MNFGSFLVLIFGISCAVSRNYIVIRVFCMYPTNSTWQCTELSIYKDTMEQDNTVIIFFMDRHLTFTILEVNKLPYKLQEVSVPFYRLPFDCIVVCTANRTDLDRSFLLWFTGHSTPSFTRSTRLRISHSFELYWDYWLGLAWNAMGSGERI